MRKELNTYPVGVPEEFAQEAAEYINKKVEEISFFHTFYLPIGYDVEEEEYNLYKDWTEGEEKESKHDDEIILQFAFNVSVEPGWLQAKIHAEFTSKVE